MGRNTGNGLLLGRMWEVRGVVLGGVAWLRLDGGVVDLRGRRATTSIPNVVLSFGRVISSILLDRLAISTCVVSCKILDLLSLRAGQVRRVFEVGVDELLVALVDQGCKVDDRGGDER